MLSTTVDINTRVGRGRKKAVPMDKVTTHSPTAVTKGVSYSEGILEVKEWVWEHAGHGIRVDRSSCDSIAAFLECSKCKEVVLL